MKQIPLIALLLSISACDSKNDCNDSGQKDPWNFLGAFHSEASPSEQPLPELQAPEYYASCQELIEDLTRTPTYTTHHYSMGDDSNTCNAEGIPVSLSDGSAAENQASTVSADGQPTNTQNGMDEADRLKISNHYVFYLNNNLIEVLSRSELQPLRTIKLGQTNEYIRGLYVFKNKLVVLSEYTEQEDPPVTILTNSSNTMLQSSAIAAMPNYNKTKIHFFDIRDEIKKLSEKVFDGSVKFSRLSPEGDMTLITNLSFYGSKEKRKAKLNSKFSGRDCTQIQKAPFETRIYGLTEVHNIDLKNEDTVVADTTEILPGHFNYGFMDKNLYLSQYHYIYRSSATRVVQLQKQGPSWKQSAQGLIYGRPISSWSFFEKGNHLFVATTGVSGRNWQRKNALNLLKKNGDRLELAWAQSIAPGERLRSARYTNDYAYLVTYREIDPLFVFDIKNPEKPILKGELKVPGFSSYMHPVDSNTLLGIGRTDDWDIQISLFDVSNPEVPLAIEQKAIDGYSIAQYDHHAFYFDSSENIFAIPTRSYQNHQRLSGANFYKVSSQGFSHLGTIDHTDFFQKICPNDLRVYSPSIRRIYSIDSRLITLSNLGLKRHNSTSPTAVLDSVMFPSAEITCRPKNN